MTPQDALQTIRHTKGCELVMVWDDGEIGCMDATTVMAELVMEEHPDKVLGIYRRQHAMYFEAELEAFHGPAWGRPLTQEAA